MRFPALVFNTKAWDCRLFQHHRAYRGKTQFPSHNWGGNGLAAERACRTAMRILMEFNLSHFNGSNILKGPICQNSWVVTANLPHCILGPLDHENTKIQAEVEVIKVGVEHDPV